MRLAEVRQRITAARERGGRNQDVTIIAVTKTHGVEAPRSALDAGIGDLGENKVQEALGKMHELERAARWHLIGHLQRNKVRQLDPFHLVHSMDSVRLADALHAYGVARDRPVDVLMQVNVAGESSKGGIDPRDVAAEAARLRSMDGVRVRGVMTMAPFDVGQEVLRPVFGGAREALERVREAGHPADELSMGMSGDYEVAVEEGATLVRLGTVLFGTRGG